MTGNKGEWSEIYTLFKLLGDKALQPGNENIEKIQGIIYPIIKILRSEKDGDFEYSVNDNIILISGDGVKLEIPVSDFKEKALYLLNVIKKQTSGTFAVDEIEKFMTEIKCSSLKAGSSAKTDITIVVHDQRTSQQPVLGFSIKSQLGSPSTLLNAGKTTNFTYKITNVVLTEEDIIKINKITSAGKIKNRLKAVLDRGGSFEFVEADKQIFSNNLVLIDSLLPQILAKMVFTFFTSNNTSVVDLVNHLEGENPLNFNAGNNHQFYRYKIKRFLMDIALGMMPGKVWTGQYDATGGYLVVKEDGEVLCYHIYNRNDFENYLLNNTKLETASSTRHGFGKIYPQKGQLFFKLNLQIRFRK